MTGQDIQEWHDRALFPYLLDFWLWNFFPFVLFLIFTLFAYYCCFMPIIAAFFFFTSF